MNGCKDKPLDLEVMKKLVKALLLGSKSQRREKII